MRGGRDDDRTSRFGLDRGPDVERPWSTGEAPVSPPSSPRRSGAAAERRLLSLADVAEFLGVPPATVYAWRYRREGPPALKIGRHLRFRLEEVEAWLETKRDPAER